MERPWAGGLDRLLKERQLKKSKFAELAGIRAATISVALHSARGPAIETLMALCRGFTTYDKRVNPTAPDVELWEFFVTDEQATLLRKNVAENHAPTTEAVDASSILNGDFTLTITLQRRRGE